MTILTWNASLSGILDKNRMEDIIEKYRLPGMVFRDDADYARYLLNKFPWFTVVLRLPWPEWHERRDDMIQEDTVDHYITFLEGKNLPWTPDHRLRMYVGNELATNAKVATWLTTCVKAFAEKGWPGDFGNFAVGNPPQETQDWIDVFPEYLFYLSLNNDLMRSGHHEYFETLPLNTNFPYRVGRTTFVDEAAEELKITRPIRKVITECGWDSPSWGERHIPQADYLMQLAYATDVIWVPAGIEMAAVFHYGENDHSEGGRWGPYNIEGTSIPVSIASRKDTAMPDYQPATAVPVYPNGTIVRAEPTITAKYVDFIAKTSPSRVILAVLEEATWVPVKRKEDGSLYAKDEEKPRWIPVHIPEIPADGYIREDVITLTPTTPQPPTPPTPPEEDDWQAKYEAEVAAHDATRAELKLRTTQRDNMVETFNNLVGQIETLRSNVDALFSAMLDEEPDVAELEGAMPEDAFVALYAPEGEAFPAGEAEPSQSGDED